MSWSESFFLDKQANAIASSRSSKLPMHIGLLMYSIHRTTTYFFIFKTKRGKTI